MGKRDIALLISQNSVRSKEFIESASFMGENDMEKDAITDLFYALYHAVCCVVLSKSNPDLEEMLHDHQYVIQYFGRYFCLERVFDEADYILLRKSYDEEFYEHLKHSHVDFKEQKEKVLNLIEKMKTYL